jgi:hypothetical protein
MTPMALNFGTLAPNTTSAPQTITVQNVGVGTLNISSMKIVAGASPNSFAVTGNTCTTTMTAGATCRVTIVLKPTVGGVQSASFTVVSNAPANGTQSVALTGTVPAPLTITASSPTVNWGTGVPTITPIVTGLLPPDTLASLAPLSCTTTYTLTSNAGTYPTTCTGATNPNNAYTITYVPGKLTVKAAPATMISPAPGGTLGYPSQTFTWTTGGAATTYQIWISTVGSGRYDLYRSAILTGTSVTVNNLPSTGLPLYVTLYTIVNGAWQSVSYTYSAAIPVKAALTFPTAGPLPSNVNFQWSPGQGVAVYLIFVSAIGPGQSEVFRSTRMTGTSQVVSNIPQGKTIYVRLYSSINGGWQYTDYTF